MRYTCERCKKREAIHTEKYCKECKRIVLKEMRESGYLQYTDRKHAGEGRTKEMKEFTHETKFGTFHG